MGPTDTDDQQPVDQAARIAELEARNAELEALVAKLMAQVELLTEKLNQNSKNSHLPPSSDGPGSGPRNVGKKSKGKTKRKRGGQKGHRGSHRSLLPADQADVVHDLFPHVCEGCSAQLPPTPCSDPLRYQQIEWLATGRQLTEWRRHEVSCDGCGARTLAEYDPDVIPASSFGPRLVAVVAMLTGVYHLSRRRAQRLLHEVLDIDISLGAISGIEARASNALVPAVAEAQQEVEQSDVKHTDATTWLRAGVTTALWTLATTAATVYRIVKDGCRETIRSFYGVLKGILVSDRAKVFDFWLMVFRQICWAHLLRKFVSFSERDGPAAAFGRELLDLTALVFDYWHGFKDGLLTRDELAVWLRPIQRQFEQTLRRAVAADIPRLSGSCADMLAHKDALWTFASRDGVEPTNNHAERELRPFVLWRKRSYGAQSDRGDRFAERIMTVAHTARKQGKDVLDFLVRCVVANDNGETAPALFEATPA